MTTGEPPEITSDLEVSICGPGHEGGWCKYCRALKQIERAADTEREACAQLADCLMLLEDDHDWQQGFNMACLILAQAIRARRHSLTEKATRSFLQLSRSLAAAHTSRNPLPLRPGDRANSCSPASPSLSSSVETLAR